MDVASNKERLAGTIARGVYTAQGTLDTIHQDVKSTRVLEVEGSKSSVTSPAPTRNSSGSTNHNRNKDNSPTVQGNTYKWDNETQTLHKFPPPGKPIRGDNQDYNDAAYPSTPSNNGTVLCSLLYRRGYLPQEIWEQDHKFGIWMSENDPDVFNGYHSWAVPMVDWIEKGSLLSKVYFHGWVRPFTGAWAQHIAHRMEPKKYKDNKVGRLMLNIGVPLCRSIGKLMRRNKGMENA